MNIKIEKTPQRSSFRRWNIIPLLAICCILSGCAIDLNLTSIFSGFDKMTKSVKPSSSKKETPKPKKTDPLDKVIEQAEQRSKKEKEEFEKAQNKENASNESRSASTTKDRPVVKESAERLLERGDALYKTGKLHDADRIYRRWLQIAEGSAPIDRQAQVHYRLALIAGKKQQYPLAQEHYQKAIQLSAGKNIDYLFDGGVLLYEIGKYAEAEKFFAQILVISPDFEKAREYQDLCQKNRAVGVQTSVAQRSVTPPLATIPIGSSSQPVAKTPVNEESLYRIPNNSLVMGTLLPGPIHEKESIPATSPTPNKTERATQTPLLAAGGPQTKSNAENENRIPKSISTVQQTIPLPGPVSSEESLSQTEKAIPKLPELNAKKTNSLASVPFPTVPTIAQKEDPVKRNPAPLSSTTPVVTEEVLMYDPNGLFALTLVPLSKGMTQQIKVPVANSASENKVAPNQTPFPTANFTPPEKSAIVTSSPQEKNPLAVNQQESERKLVSKSTVTADTMTKSNEKISSPFPKIDLSNLTASAPAAQPNGTPVQTEAPIQKIALKSIAEQAPQSGGVLLPNVDQDAISTGVYLSDLPKETPPKNQESFDDDSNFGFAESRNFMPLTRLPAPFAKELKVSAPESQLPQVIDIPEPKEEPALQKMTSPGIEIVPISREQYRKALANGPEKAAKSRALANTSAKPSDVDKNTKKAPTLQTQPVKDVQKTKTKKFSIFAPGKQVELPKFLTGLHLKKSTPKE